MAQELQDKQHKQPALEVVAATQETTTTTTTIAPTMTLETQVSATTPCAAAAAAAKLPSIEATIIDIPSSSSSSYDTDSSTASSTCCTHPNEHIYMERPRHQQQQQHHQQQQQQQQQQQHHHPQLQHHHHHHQFPAPDAEVNIELMQYKAEQRRSWPFFVLVISLIEIAVFLFDYMTVRPQPTLQAPIPSDSVLIYRPDRRQQLWRFISYMVLHANWFHLSFNVVIQLLFGIPLEVMHGSARIAVIYFAGVFAGSLGTSVVDSEVYLVGASGGVYALLAAHLANIMLNYGQMKYAVAQLVSVLIFVSCDLGYAFYTQYLAAVQLSQAPAVSYIAHLTGALAGLTIGLLVLRNFEHRAHENLIWWLALGVYTAFTIFAIVFNLINTVTAQLMEEQGEVITQHLLHDLGVS